MVSIHGEPSNLSNGCLNDNHCRSKCRNPAGQRAHPRFDLLLLPGHQRAGAALAGHAHPAHRHPATAGCCSWRGTRRATRGAAAAGRRGHVGGAAGPGATQRQCATCYYTATGNGKPTRARAAGAVDARPRPHQAAARRHGRVTGQGCAGHHPPRHPPQGQHPSGRAPTCPPCQRSGGSGNVAAGPEQRDVDHRGLVDRSGAQHGDGTWQRAGHAAHAAAGAVHAGCRGGGWRCMRGAGVARGGPAGGEPARGGAARSPA